MATVAAAYCCSCFLRVQTNLNRFNYGKDVCDNCKMTISRPKIWWRNNHKKGKGVQV